MARGTVAFIRALGFESKVITRCRAATPSTILGSIRGVTAARATPDTDLRPHPDSVAADAGAGRERARRIGGEATPECWSSPRPSWASGRAPRLGPVGRSWGWRGTLGGILGHGLDRVLVGGVVSTVRVSVVDHAVNAAGLATSSGSVGGLVMSFMLASPAVGRHAPSRDWPRRRPQVHQAPTAPGRTGKWSGTTAPCRSNGLTARSSSATPSGRQPLHLVGVLQHST